MNLLLKSRIKRHARQVAAGRQRAKRCVLFAISICFAIGVAAQGEAKEYATVKGVVMDSASNTTIPYATVSVLKQSDMTKYVLRTVTDTEGRFAVEVDMMDSFIFAFESISVVPEYKPVVTDKATVELGDILMNEAITEMQEVMVAAQKPLVKSAIDRISYDIASDPDAATSSTLEMLNKVPLLTVGQDDEIKLKGSTKYKVHINGKPSNLVANSPSMALKSIPASTVERIEVITEPGAKYDSEGLDGIINIITKSALSGYMMSLNAFGGTMPTAGGGLYFTTKVGKFGMSVNAQYHHGQMNYASDIMTEYKSNPATKFLNTNSNGRYIYNSFYGNLQASYEFDSLRLLSLSVGGSGNLSDTKTNALSSNIGHMGDTIASYAMGSNGNNLYSGITAALDYQRSFKKADQNLTFSYLLSYTPNNSTSYSDVVGVNYPTYQQTLESKANNNEHTVQVDYTEPFAKKHIMEVGAKYILRQNQGHNTSFLLDTVSGIWEEEAADENSDLQQVQHIIGAYGSYSLRLKKWNFRAGARMEYMMQDVNTADTAFQYSFFNVIPSVNISYNPAEGHHLSLGYTQRLSRPGIWYLNPFWDDSTPYYVSQGNPDLNPEVGHTMSVSYGYYSQKVNINTSISGSYVNNSIEQVSSIINDTILYSTYENIGKSLSTYGSLYVQWNICKWASLWTNAGVSYSHYESGDELGLMNSGWNVNVHAGTQISLPWKLKLGANGGYATPSVTLQGRSNGYHYYTLNLKRAFVKERLNVGFSANNFANKYMYYSGYSETEHYRQDYTSRNQGMNFQVNVSYRFGEMKEQVKTVKKGIKNEDGMSSGSGSGGGAGGGGGGK